jgi:hypothetical protein
MRNRRGMENPMSGKSIWFALVVVLSIAVVTPMHAGRKAVIVTASVT